MTRALAALVLALAALAALPSAASALTVSCSFDATTRVLTVTDRDTTAADDGDAIVRRSGDAIAVSEQRVSGPAAAVTCTGPAATVTSTERIDVRANRNTRPGISLDGGSLAPGFTDEGDGSSEIEITFIGYANFFVGGSEAADRIRAGTAGGVTTLNLNPGEAVPDADLTVDGGYWVRVALGAGDDVFDGRGGAGTGELAALPLTVDGDAGDDALTGGAGSSDFLEGGDGNDTLTAAGAKESRLRGEAGSDSLVAGAGHDTLVPGAGDDTLTGTGAGGQDTLMFHVSNWEPSPGVRVDLQTTGPQDTGQGLDTIAPGIEVLEGTSGPDVLRGTDGPERIYSGPGDDVLEGRGGDDKLENSGGVDLVDYSGAPGPVTVDLSGAAPHATGAAGNDQLRYIQGVTGSSHDDHLTGDAWRNRIQGGPGEDELFGGGQDDVLEGGTGADSLSGGDGWDFLRPGSSATGGPEGADTVDGGRGIDTLTYGERTGGVAVQLDGRRNDGADPNGDGLSTASEEGDLALGIERVNGGSGPDRMRGYGGNSNVFVGYGGDDFLMGGVGRDYLHGGAGVDTVSYSLRTKTVVVSLDEKRNDGTDADGDGKSDWGEEADLILQAENVIGGSGDDRLVGSAAANVLTGGPGADFLDAFDGTTLVDRLVCGTGTDTFAADPSDTTDGCEAPAT